MTTFINLKKMCLRTELHRLFKKFTCQEMEQLQRTLNSKTGQERGEEQAFDLAALGHSITIQCQAVIYVSYKHKHKHSYS